MRDEQNYDNMMSDTIIAFILQNYQTITKRVGRHDL